MYQYLASRRRVWHQSVDIVLVFGLWIDFLHIMDVQKYYQKALPWVSESDCSCLTICPKLLYLWFLTNAMMDFVQILTLWDWYCIWSSGSDFLQVKGQAKSDVVKFDDINCVHDFLILQVTGYWPNMYLSY